MTSTFALRGRRGTWRHLPTQHSPSFCVAGVALGGIYLGFAWQAWHLWHWAGSGGALGRAWLPVTPRHFAWQAWHLVTSTFALRGKRGTWRHLPTQHSPSFCVAGVELKALGWLWWRAGLVAGDAAALCVAGVALMALGWHWAGSGGALGRAWSPDAAALCVAGVALGDIHRRFARQAWHLEASTLVLRGRRGTYGTGLALVARLGGLVAGDAAVLCVAGLALGDIHRHITWQAWHLVTSSFILRGSRGTLLGRCGTTQHSPSFCVAGVALEDIHLRFAWQVWHLETSNCMPFAWAACAWKHPLWFCVAGVALGDIDLPFAWYRTASRTIFHIQLCPTQIVTQLCHTSSFLHTNVSHRTCHTITQLCHTPSLAQCMRLPFCVQTINALHTITNSVTHHL